MKQEDIDFVKSILPEEYIVEESARKGSIRCHTKGKGIYKNIDGEDDEHWDYIVKAIKKRFSLSFLEIYHYTCTNHLDFVIFLKAE